MINVLKRIGDWLLSWVVPIQDAPKQITPEQITPEQMWDKFIDHLNEVQPLKGDDAKHMNFLGSIASYRKLFMQANKPDPSPDQKD